LTRTATAQRGCIGARTGAANTEHSL